MSMADGTDRRWLAFQALGAGIRFFIKPSACSSVQAGELPALCRRTARRSVTVVGYYGHWFGRSFSMLVESSSRLAH